jgi:tetratricopeptide (TPR) repeat protein
MTNNRQRLEQEALQALNRGSVDGALQAYLNILRSDPKDRRIRQKVGDIYLKLGKQQDAERHLREVAEGLLKEGSHRMAVAVLKQLVGLKPDEPALHMDLGECYVAAGYGNDARVHFDTAMRLHVGASKPLEAAKAARRLADLAPAELPARMKLAELLEAGGDPAGAVTAFAEVLEEYRRRGRKDEVGRIAEIILKLKPDDVGTLLDAAAARVDAADHKKALGFLQVAFSAAPKEPRTLDLLSRAFEGVGQVEKAFKILVELSRVASERGDAQSEVDALRRAAGIMPTDLDVKTRLADAEQRVQRLERRLTSLVLSQAANEDELRVQVRAEVLARYGFFSRAEQALRGGLQVRADSVPLLASLAEVLVADGRADEALRVMERVLPHAGPERDQVLDRMVVLKGAAPDDLEEDDLGDAATSPGADEEEVVDQDSEIAPRGGESAEQRGDRLAESGDLVGAVTAYREALQEDPLNDGILAKFAALRQRGREATPAAPARAAPPAEDVDPFASLLEHDGTFAEVSPTELEPVGGDTLEEARSLVSVGMHRQALELLEAAGDGLVVCTLRAQALRGMQKTQAALEALRDVVDEAGVGDEGYREALLELSGLFVATGKHRPALRVLDELAELDPAFRKAEVEAMRKAVKRLVG